MKLKPENTTTQIGKEDLAVIRYYFDGDTDYEKIHELVNIGIPQAVRNTAHRLYGRRVIK